jgi:Na+-transporting NADH:ubiquinone oxidoreductase subunit NqrF
MNRENEYKARILMTEFVTHDMKRFIVEKQNFYVCGPPKFVEAITKILRKLGAKVDSIVIEE